MNHYEWNYDEVQTQKILGPEEWDAYDEYYYKVVNQTYELTQHTMSGPKNSCRMSATPAISILNYRDMAAPLFKRPTPRPGSVAPLTFVSTFHNGARVSEWVVAPSRSRIPSGTPGRVGEIADAMNRGDGAVARVKTHWTPPTTYEFIASKMPKEQGDAYIKRAEEWIAAHPPRALREPPPPLEYDMEMVAVYFQKLRTMPDKSELMKLWRRAGIPEARILQSLAWHEKEEAMADENQQKIDAIFGPAEVKKIKKVAKVIKAVKKRA